MPKDLVFNERSILGSNPSDPNILSVLNEVAELPTAVDGEAAVLWMWEGLNDAGTPEGGLFNQLLQRVKSAKLPLDQRRRILRRLWDRVMTFQENLALDVLFEGASARGLGRAHELQGLALSMRTASIWEQSTLPVLVHSLSNGTFETKGNIRHAAQKTHLLKHIEWKEIADVDRLRLLLSVQGSKHHDASSYSHKHVQGGDNEARRRAAQAPAGAAQFLAERGGVRITDTTIRDWESEVLERVKRNDPSCHVRRHGSGQSYHVYCELAHEVGFEAKSGDMTRWIRVEWSEGFVHSHPHSLT